MDKKAPHDSISIYLWGPIRITGAYLVVGVLWILFSDKIAERLASTPAILTQISIYKGWGYVVVTALLLYLLIRNHTEKVSKTEQKLHESEENYKELLNNASDGIFIAHANGQYVFVNEEACKLVGYTRNELLSMQVKDLIAPEDLSRSPLRFGQLHKGETYIFERVLVRKDGSRIISELSASILPDGRYQSIVRDITERKVAEKALERSERRYRSLFENMINGFSRCQMIYNVDGEPIDFIYLEVNEAFKELTGLRDVIGKRVTDLIPGIRETNPELFEVYGQVAKTGKPRKFESYLAGLGAGAWFSVSAYSMEKGFFMAVFDAITERKQAEQALQRNERLFRLFIEHAPAEIAMFDRDMKYIAASQRYIQDYKLKQKNIIGYSHYEILPEIPERWKAIHQRCLAGATESSEADPFPRADGTLDWVKWEIHPWYEEENTIGGIILLSEVITERMRAEIAVRENEERLRLSLQAANQGLYDLNVQTGNAVVNKEYAEMLGYDPNTFVETNAAWIERLHPDDRELAAKAYSDYINGLTAKYRVEFRQRTRDGNWKWILSLGKVVEHDPDGKPLRMLGTHTDITRRKQAEEEIRILNDELEQRVIERTSQLEAANKELEAFSYSVSHDLRAPLRAIDGFTRILLEDYQPLLGDEGKRVCSVISDETVRMGKLIDDLLAFSRLSRANMHIVGIDMQAQAQMVFDELTREGERDRIDFRIEKLPEISGDTSLMRQVWTNLIANAIKFSSRKKRAVIEVGCTQQESEVVYYVRDNGAGFDMEYENKLFSVFQRLHSENEFEGTGVGLAIVQRVIHRHGGRVWATGKINEGATFYFAIPQKRGNNGRDRSGRDPAG